MSQVIHRIKRCGIMGRVIGSRFAKEFHTGWTEEQYMKEFLKKYQDKWIVLRTKSGLDPAGVVEKIDNDVVTLRYERHGSEPVYWFIQLTEIEGIFVNPKELDSTKKK